MTFISINRYYKHTTKQWDNEIERIIRIVGVLGHYNEDRRCPVGGVLLVSQNGVGDGKTTELDTNNSG